jgi:hypothetical protein
MAEAADADEYYRGEVLTLCQAAEDSGALVVLVILDGMRRR